MNNWPAKFQMWCDPPSTTEDERCQNAERMIKDAIRDCLELSMFNIDVFAQGSYKANTNIRLGSDVDVCICLRDACFVKYPSGYQDADYGLSDNQLISFADFRERVRKALVAKFGHTNVKPGSKAINIRENSYRVTADAVPAFEFRRYWDGSRKFSKGIAFLPEGGAYIHNYPAQAYYNGVQKNERTSRRYKSVVRILKKLRDEMKSSGKLSVDIPSFLIESLVWNVDDQAFENPDIVDLVTKVLVVVITEISNGDAFEKWREVNSIKFLFKAGQPWTTEVALRFALEAYQFIQ